MPRLSKRSLTIAATALFAAASSYLGSALLGARAQAAVAAPAVTVQSSRLSMESGPERSRERREGPSYRADVALTHTGRRRVRRPGSGNGGMAIPSERFSSAGRALVVFVPSRHPGDLRLLSIAQSRGDFSLGLVSPALGRGVPGLQTYLDIGQGARVDDSLYGPLPAGTGRLRADRLGLRAVGFDAIKERAGGVPAEIKPGLLAETLRLKGIRVAYAARAGERPLARQPTALAAVDEDGFVRSAGWTRSLEAPVAQSQVVVVSLPSGSLDAVLKIVDPADTVILIGQPPAAGTDGHQLPLAVRAGKGGGRLTSPSTRTPGLVLSTDITATVLQRFGIDLPAEVQGKPIEISGHTNVESLESLDKRMAVITPRRLVALGFVAGAAAFLIFLLWLVRGGDGFRLGLRATALTLLWLPAVMLLAAALKPAQAEEYALITSVGLSLGGLSAAWLPARLAPVVAVTVSIAATTVDLAFGSLLTRLSLMGPNPAFGARFYGVGNELEAYLGISFLLVVGLVADSFWPRRRSLALVLLGVLFAFVLGWGRLGADVGAVIVLSIGVAVAALIAHEGRLSPRKIWLLVTVPIAALAVLMLLDLAAGGGTHLSDTFLGGNGLNSLGDVVERRLTLAYKAFLRPNTIVFALTGIGLLAVGLRYRRRLLAPLSGGRARATRAGAIGALAATVCGLFVNDSGPIVLIIGVVELLLFLGYIWSVPNDALFGKRR